MEGIDCYALKCTKHHYLQELVCFYYNTCIHPFVCSEMEGGGGGGLQPPIVPLNPPLNS